MAPKTSAYSRRVRCAGQTAPPLPALPVSHSVLLTLQAVVIFVMTIIAYRPIYADRHSGTTFSHWQTGATLFTAVLLTIHLEITSIIDRWTWLHHLAVEGSICEWSLPCCFICSS